jgi:hypothetical protein
MRRGPHALKERRWLILLLYYVSEIWFNEISEH